MSNKFVAFTVCSKGDQFWEQQEFELRENLKQYDIPLETGWLRETQRKFDNIKDFQLIFNRKWKILLDFFQNNRNSQHRFLILDAEMRMHNPLPNLWINSHHSIFFKRVNYPNNPVLVLQSGQFVFYPKDFDILEYAIDKFRVDQLNNYNSKFLAQDFLVNAVIELKKNVHVEGIDYNREKNDDYTVNRGHWAGKNTVLTHPRDQGWSGSIDRIKFLNHFKLDSLQTAIKVYMLIISQNTNKDTWKRLGAVHIGKLEQFSNFVSMNNEIKDIDYNSDCFELDNYIFCPHMKILSPKKLLYKIGFIILS